MCYIVLLIRKSHRFRSQHAIAGKFAACMVAFISEVENAPAEALKTRIASKVLVLVIGFVLIVLLFVICLFASLLICLFACLLVCLFACLFVCLFVCLFAVLVVLVVAAAAGVVVAAAAAAVVVVVVVVATAGVVIFCLIISMMCSSFLSSLFICPGYQAALLSSVQGVTNRHTIRRSDSPLGPVQMDSRTKRRAPAETTRVQILDQSSHVITPMVSSIVVTLYINNKDINLKTPTIKYFENINTSMHTHRQV